MMNNKLKVIVFGNVPLSTWVVKKVLGYNLIELIGVVCEKYPENAFYHHGLDEMNTYDFCKENNLNIISFDEAGEIADKLDVLGLSVRYYKLFKEDYINRFKKGILNFHGGELPRFRGINIANHVILEGVEECAGTIHFVDKGIDTGDIVFREYQKINSNDTAYTCFIKIQSCLQMAFINLLDYYQEYRNIPRKSQCKFISDGEETKTYYKRDLIGKRLITDNELNTSLMNTKVRAFTFPGHEPAFIIYNNIKHFITL